jgi:hypothetical protein
LVDVLRQRPDVSAVSGRTNYGNETAYRRALSLVDRSFDDLGGPGVAGSVSNNGALYRRSLLVRFPYPPAVTPFTSARLRAEAMRQAGHVFFFEPAAVTRHAIGGWDFIRDFRRHTGYSDICSVTRREGYGASRVYPGGADAERPATASVWAPPTCAGMTGR